MSIETRYIKATKGWHGVGGFYVSFIEDGEIYLDGINIESILFKPSFRPLNGNYGSAEHQIAVAVVLEDCLIDIMDYLSREAFDEVMVMLRQVLNDEKEAAELEREVENYR